MRDLFRFEVSLCFICRKVYPEWLEARISAAIKKLKRAQKTPTKLRDLLRFEISLRFLCRKVYLERLEARISEAAKKLKITQR